MALNASQVQVLIRSWVPMAEDIDLQIEEVREGYARIRIPFQENRIHSYEDY